MPHIRIRSLSDSAVKDLSRSLPKELAPLLGTPEDNFTVEKVATTYYRGGNTLQENDVDPMIEFLWFERGTDIRAAAAAKITELVKAFSKSQFIAVVFVPLRKEDYFENGVRF